MAKSTAKKIGTAFTVVESIPVGRIFLALDNPRHEAVESESEAIERLCAKEDVVPLARDIVRHGLSPLERFALTPINKTKSGDPTYFVAEGNRRICALKLLADPELAPPAHRKTFESLAEDWSPIEIVQGVVFENVETLHLWLDRVHSGTQGGIGRKNWDAEQKQRFSGSSKNRLAQAVLDYAESEGMLTKEQREGKLTTAQRFLSPEAVQETFGIDRSNPEELGRTRPKAEFDVMLKRFISDLVEGKQVTSRMNKPEIVKYARTLSVLPGVSNNRIESEPIVNVATAKKTRVRRTPRKPERARHVAYSDEISAALKVLENEKLQSLYYSICALELEQHAPIVAIGIWAFMETLTGVAGRADGIAFDAFLSKERLTKFGVTGDDQKAARSSVARIAEYGNQTKHHKVSAAFNGDQINNDMIVLNSTISRLISEAETKR
jgi:hypothetical protein